MHIFCNRISGTALIEVLERNQKTARKEDMMEKIDYFVQGLIEGWTARIQDWAWNV